MSFSVGWKSEQRASLRVLDSVSQERDILRQEPQHLRNKYHRSDVLQGRLTFQLSEAWEPGEYFHDINERNLRESL